jgi:hypothetical protein
VQRQHMARKLSRQATLPAMRTRDDNQIEISGPGWRAVHARRTVNGPQSLTVNDTEILRDCVCCVGGLADRAAVIDSIRDNRNSNADVVIVNGTLPFGNEIEFLHTYRYGDGFARIITDLTFRRGSTAAPSVDIGSLTLPGPWKSYRIATDVDNELRLSDWRTIEDVTWNQPPLAVILEHQSGVQLEIGTGNDLWRWQKGLLTPQTNTGCYALKTSGDDLEFSRSVTICSADTVPKPRVYRFSWYLAWQGLTTTTDLPTETVEPVFSDDGSLDAAATGAQLTSGTYLALDLAAVTWPPTLCRARDGRKSTRPCLASSAVMTRLRRIVRQLAGLEQQEFALVFRNLQPGLCDVGRHVDQKKSTAHWDMSDLLAFSLWARGCLGPERRILVDCAGFDCPSMNRLFACLPQENEFFDAWDDE